MPLMMTPVHSSICIEIGYDDETGELHVLHGNGSTSIYGTPERPVSPETAGAVMGADSVGKAYHAMIRGQYPHRYL